MKIKAEELSGRIRVPSAVDVLPEHQPRGYSGRLPLSRDIEAWINIFGGAPTHEQFQLLKNYIDQMDVALNGAVRESVFVPPPISVEPPTIEPESPPLQETRSRRSPPLSSMLRQEIELFARSRLNLTLADIARRFANQASQPQIREFLIKAGIHHPNHRKFLGDAISSPNGDVVESSVKKIGPF